MKYAYSILTALFLTTSMIPVQAMDDSIHSHSAHEKTLLSEVIAQPGDRIILKDHNVISIMRDKECVKSFNLPQTLQNIQSVSLSLNGDMLHIIGTTDDNVPRPYECRNLPALASVVTLYNDSALVHPLIPGNVSTHAVSADGIFCCVIGMPYYSDNQSMIQYMAVHMRSKDEEYSTRPIISVYPEMNILMTSLYGETHIYGSHTPEDSSESSFFQQDLNSHTLLLEGTPSTLIKNLSKPIQGIVQDAQGVLYPWNSDGMWMIQEGHARPIQFQKINSNIKQVLFQRQENIIYILGDYSTRSERGALREGERIEYIQDTHPPKVIEVHLDKINTIVFDEAKHLRAYGKFNYYDPRKDAYVKIVRGIAEKREIYVEDIDAAVLALKNNASHDVIWDFSLSMVLDAYSQRLKDLGVESRENDEASLILKQCIAAIHRVKMATLRPKDKIAFQRFWAEHAAMLTQDEAFVALLNDIVDQETHSLLPYASECLFHVFREGAQLLIHNDSNFDSLIKQIDSVSEGSQTLQEKLANTEQGFQLLSHVYQDPQIDSDLKESWYPKIRKALQIFGRLPFKTYDLEMYHALETLTYAARTENNPSSKALKGAIEFLSQEENLKKLQTYHDAYYTSDEYADAAEMLEVASHLLKKVIESHESSSPLTQAYALTQQTLSKFASDLKEDSAQKHWNEGLQDVSAAYDILQGVLKFQQEALPVDDRLLLESVASICESLEIAGTYQKLYQSAAHIIPQLREKPAEITENQIHTFQDITSTVLRLQHLTRHTTPQEEAQIDQFLRDVFIDKQ